jgi:hypothetical protein
MKQMEGKNKLKQIKFWSRTNTSDSSSKWRTTSITIKLKDKRPLSNLGETSPNLGFCKPSL